MRVIVAAGAALLVGATWAGCGDKGSANALR